MTLVAHLGIKFKTPGDYHPFDNCERFNFTIILNKGSVVDQSKFVRDFDSRQKIVETLFINVTYR